MRSSFGNSTFANIIKFQKKGKKERDENASIRAKKLAHTHFTQFALDKQKNFPLIIFVEFAF